jgi:hypothetical protein
MALTYRKVKGSALTIDELDANFAHFTGSHSITGSLTVSGSIIPSEVNGTLGTATAPWKELFVDGGTIYFISGSSSGSLGWSSGSGFNFGTGSVTFDGGLTVTGSVTISGSSTLTNIGPFITTGESTFNGDVWVKSTSGNVGELLITSLINNHTSSFYTDNSGNLNIVSGGSVVFKAGNNGVQATIPFTASQGVGFTGIANTTQPYILGYDSSTGNITYYSTGSFGGGSSTDTGSLMLTGSVAGNVLTFTKGDASTFDLTVDTGSASGTIDTGSFYVSSSVNGNVITFNQGDGTSPSITVDTGSIVGSVGNLQQVTDSGSSTTNTISVTSATGPQLILQDASSSITIGEQAGGNYSNDLNPGAEYGRVVIGDYALSSSITSFPTIAIGYGALQNAVTSRSDVAIGYKALNKALTTGDNGIGNVAIGHLAMSASYYGIAGANGPEGVTAIGPSAGLWNSGSFNTYVGTAAGGFNSQFSSDVFTNYSIYLGYGAAPHPDGGDNQIVINAHSASYIGKGADTVQIGNPFITHTYLYGQITGSSGLYVATSSFGNLDIKFKNLPTSSTGLDTGSLWLSGSDGAGSSYLMVFNP